MSGHSDMHFDIRGGCGRLFELRNQFVAVRSSSDWHGKSNFASSSLSFCVYACKPTYQNIYFLVVEVTLRMKARSRKAFEINHSAPSFYRHLILRGAFRKIPCFDGSSPTEHRPTAIPLLVRGFLTCSSTEGFKSISCTSFTSQWELLFKSNKLFIIIHL